MTPQRWQEVKNTLAAALERTDKRERNEFLTGACAEDAELRREVESLLAQPEDEFELVAEAMNVASGDSLSSANLGRRVGAYELNRELGRGGMGTVWLARRADQHFEKLVAIKLMKRGMDTDEVLRRFHAERQILARLDHPNIARLLDAGTTDDGLPYFVMEYVEGRRLIDFVRDKKLPLGDRLRLFLKICGAVQFAHQNLVVHRDLKPGNILVTPEGEPKLLDFGVAKLLAPGDDAWLTTIAGQERFTPAYASPEQARGEPITTVSDVYSLGSLLFEMLTGSAPHRFPTTTPSATQIAQVICEKEPPRPSMAALEVELRRPLRGDLDTIVLRALAKDPARRYRGAGQLADDVRRHLENRPVRARPDTFPYRAGKFFRRNKAGAVAAALILLALVGGSVTTFWQARRANRRFNDVRKIANSLMFEFHDAIKDIPGALHARQLVIRRALEYLDSLGREAGNDLSLKSELATAYNRIGGITFDVRQAIESREKAVVLNEALVRAAPSSVTYRRQLSENYDALSDVMIISGHSRQAIEYAEKALVVMKKLSLDRPTDFDIQALLAQGYTALSIAQMDAGNAKDGLEAALLAMAVQQKLVARRPSDAEALRTLAGIFGRVSDAYQDLGDLATALGYGQKEMELAQQIFASDQSNTRYRRNMWATYLRSGRQLAAAGNGEAALGYYGKARELMEKLLADDPDDAGHRRWLAVTYELIADALVLQKRFDEAAVRYRQSIAMSEELVQRDPYRVEAFRDLTRAEEAFSLSLSKINQPERASKHLKKAERLAGESARRDPDNARAQDLFAKIHRECELLSR